MNVINVLGPVMVIQIFRFVIDWSIRKDGDEEKEEELQPDAFNADLQRLATAAVELEQFYQQVIVWLYPCNEA